MQRLGIRAGREGAHGWLDFLAVTVTSYFLINWQKGGELEEKVEVSHQDFGRHNIQRSPVVHSAGSSFWFGLGKKQWDG